MCTAGSLCGEIQIIDVPVVSARSIFNGQLNQTALYHSWCCARYLIHQRQNFLLTMCVPHAGQFADHRCWTAPPRYRSPENVTSRSRGGQLLQQLVLRNGDRFGRDHQSDCADESRRAAPGSCSRTNCESHSADRTIGEPTGAIASVLIHKHHGFEAR